MGEKKLFYLHELHMHHRYIIGVSIDVHFDYHDTITITETTITILSLLWHTIMILSGLSTMILKHG